MKSNVILNCVPALVVLIVNLMFLVFRKVHVPSEFDVHQHGVPRRAENLFIKWNKFINKFKKKEIADTIQ